MYFDFDEPKAPTGSTFKDMPMEPAVDNCSGACSGPAVVLLILLAVIAFGFYKGYGLNRFHEFDILDPY